MAAMVRVPLMHTGGTVDFLPGSKRHKQTGGFEAVAATSAPRLFFACHAAARAMTVAALRRVLEFYDLSTEGSKEVMTQRFFDFIGV